MRTNDLQSMLRRVMANEQANVPDAQLLLRYVESRDERAFAGLVQRHGRLVWGMCRNMLRCEADADDAFQAAFLVLARSAKSVRDPARLGSWLHGVAYRICLKQRQAEARRRHREQATAKPEATRPVADSQWADAYNVIHEEVQRLPQGQRDAFILCGLQGVGLSEAAKQLGWKLGTLSGRFSRAKQTLMQRLTQRGVALGLFGTLATTSTLSQATVPWAVTTRTTELLQQGSIVPSSILTLTYGVTGMMIHKTKLLVAALLIAGSVGTSTTLFVQADEPKESSENKGVRVLVRKADEKKDDNAKKKEDETRTQWGQHPDGTLYVFTPSDFHYYVPNGSLTPQRFEAIVFNQKKTFVGTMTMAVDFNSEYVTVEEGVDKTSDKPVQVLIFEKQELPKLDPFQWQNQQHQWQSNNGEQQSKANAGKLLGLRLDGQGQRSLSANGDSASGLYVVPETVKGIRLRSGADKKLWVTQEQVQEALSNLQGAQNRVAAFRYQMKAAGDDPKLEVAYLQAQIDMHKANLAAAEVQERFKQLQKASPKTLAELEQEQIEQLQAKLDALKEHYNKPQKTTIRKFFKLGDKTKLEGKVMVQVLKTLQVLEPPEGTLTIELNEKENVIILTGVTEDVAWAEKNIKAMMKQ